MLLHFLIIAGLGIQFCERTPAIHPQHVSFLRDISTRERADLRVHILLELSEGKGRTGTIRWLGKEVREEIGEVSFH